MTCSSPSSRGCSRVELLARVLSVSVHRLWKRGLDRGYRTLPPTGAEHAARGAHRDCIPELKGAPPWPWSWPWELEDGQRRTDTLRVSAMAVAGARVERAACTPGGGSDARASCGEVMASSASTAWVGELTDRPILGR
jgi:hypothetical protein